MKLTIELVPKSSWFKNLRSELSKENWDKLRKRCYREADYRCEICGGKGEKWPVECHEIWGYEKSNRQVLKGLIALCPKCHKVKHIGLAEVNGEIENCISHLMLVNRVSRDKALQQISEAFDLWRERSKESWDVDISWIYNQL